jgi:three-Cys-motif partner protein
MRRPERLIVNHHEPDPCEGLRVQANEDNCGVGTWVPRIKHSQLCKYIDSAYGAARSPKWPGGWVYLDPFCGAGRIRVAGETQTRHGGAALAWRQSQLSGTPFRKVLIGDLDPVSLHACEARLTRLGAPVQGFNAPAVESIEKMIAEVPKGALCLAYIDPYKIGVLAFDIFRTLAEMQVDIIVNFFSSDLRRNVDSAKDELNPGWKQRLAGQMNKSSLAAAWFDDWQTQVRALGFKMSESMQTVPNSKNSEMYRLVFFAKRSFPIGLWDEVSVDQNLALFPGPD